MEMILSREFYRREARRELYQEALVSIALLLLLATGIGFFGQ